MIIFEYLLQILIAFHVPIQIIMQMLKNNHHMLPKFKAVQEFNNPLSALALALHQFFKKSNLNICIIYVELFIFADFCCHNLFLGVCMINAFYDLAKSSLVNNSDYLISVAQLFANLCFVVAFLVSNLVLILPPNFSNSVDFFENSQFNFFKFGQFWPEKFECFLGPIAVTFGQSGLGTGGLGLS